jgi:hypothetical protein
MEEEMLTEMKINFNNVITEVTASQFALRG